MFDGTPVTRPSELLTALLARPTPLLRTFTENLMAYALGRRIEYFDQPAIRSIVRDAAKTNYRLSSFILGVARTPAFQRQGPGSQPPVEERAAAPRSAEEAHQPWQ
jgi:hypothetical protein